MGVHITATAEQRVANTQWPVEGLCMLAALMCNMMVLQVRSPSLCNYVYLVPVPEAWPRV